MSHHTAGLQRSVDACTTLYDVSLALSDQLLWFDDAYFQPFVRWVAPRLWTFLLWVSTAFVRWVQETLEHFMHWDLDAIRWAAISLTVPPMKVPPELAPARPPLGLLPEARMQMRVLITPPSVKATARKRKSAMATRKRKMPQKKVMEG